MITKAIILSIDYSGNTCVVRMPFFENGTLGDKAIATAIFATTPGSYNGYKEDDVVLVGFEDNTLANPVVIGKLYLGAAKENADPRGTVNCVETFASKSCKLPLDTKIESSQTQNTAEVANTSTTYKSLDSVVEKVVKLDNITLKATDDIRIELASTDMVTSTDTQDSLTISIRDANKNIIPGDILEIGVFRTWKPSTKLNSHHTKRKRKFKSLVKYTVTTADLADDAYVKYGIIHMVIHVNLDLVHRLYKSYSSSNTRKHKLIRVRRIIDSTLGLTQYSNEIPVVFGSNQTRTIIQLINM